MERIAALGIAGVKVDFFHSDKPDSIQLYLDILEDAADFELLVVFHGSTVPRGWFLPTTPGTRFVTLGGAVANDVHGKNHHKDGSMASCVQWVDIMDAQGRVRRCSPFENAELFRWIPGSMGLTGIILRAAIKLRAYVRSPMARIR